MNFNNEAEFEEALIKMLSENGWKKSASTLLSIPMAHEMIGFYTVPDASGWMKKSLEI